MIPKGHSISEIENRRIMPWLSTDKTVYKTQHSKLQTEDLEPYQKKRG